MLDGGRGRDGKDHLSNSSGDHSFQVMMMFVRHLLLHCVVHVKTCNLFIQVKEELEALIKTHDVLQDEV